MAFSYKPLWKLLIDRDMTKKQLMQVTGISKSTMDEIIDRICFHLQCNVENVIEHIER